MDSSTVRLVLSILAVVLLGLIIMRRKNKAE